MNNRQLEIRDFIISLAYRTLGITNEQISLFFDKYSYDTIHTLAEIKAEIQADMLELQTEISKRNVEKSLFLAYNITNEKELLEFIRKNKEVGFLCFQTPMIHKFPLGGLKEDNIKNKVTTYDDHRIVSFLQDYYHDIPDYEKKDKTTLSDLLSLSSYHLLRKTWQLHSYEDTLKYMIGTEPDILELEVAFFEQLGYPYQRYQISSIRNPHEDHLFLGYKKNDHWYYYEPLFEPFIGIHEFSSKKEMEQVVLTRFMTYYTSRFDKKLISLTDYSKEQKEIYRRAMEFQDRAIYDYRLSRSNEEDNTPKLSLAFEKSSYEKWNMSLSLLETLPRTFEFYQLKELRKPELGYSYSDYRSYLYYQKKVEHKEVKHLYEIEQRLLKFVTMGVLTPGTMIQSDNVVIYQKIEFPAKITVLDEKKRNQQILLLLHQSLFHLVYYSVSSDRSIIRLDTKGEFEQIKGVDLFDINANINKYPLINNKSPYALRITPDHQLQFRGMVSYESLYKEKMLHEQFFSCHFLCPKDIELIDISSDFLEKYRLPQRKEKVEDYFQRIGLKSRVDTQLTEDFIKKHPKGLWFGQVRRHILNPFSISDLGTYLLEENKEKIEEILNFTCYNIGEETPNLQAYLLYFAKTIGKQLAILFNQNYYYQVHSLNGITLNGEICDGKFVSYYEAIEEITEKGRLNKKDNKLSDIDKMYKNIQFSYFFQFFTLARSLKTLFEAFYLLTKKNIETPVLIVFLGRFLGGLVSEKQEEFFRFFKELKDSQELLSMIKTNFSTEYQLIEDNRVFLGKMLSILEDFADCPQEIVEKTIAILKEQDFVNSILTMKTEDRFVHYIKRRFLEGEFNLKTVTLEELCDDSKIGLLLKREPIMVHTITTLLEYKITKLSTFCEVGHDIIEFEKCDNLARRDELKKKLAKYQNKENNHSEVIVIDLDNNDLLSELITKPSVAFTSTSGITTIVYLVFVFLGTLLITIGIVLSFII